MGDTETAWTAALIEFVEKTALLRETIKRRGDEGHYAARLERMTQKLEVLATALQTTDPATAATLRSAWSRPVRSLAFRNAAHQKERDD
jgi:hypothetical protein